MMQGGKQDRGTQFDRGCPIGEHREHGRQGWEVAFLEKMVLGDPDRVEPDLLNEDSLIEQPFVEVWPRHSHLGRITIVVPDSQFRHFATSISTFTSPLPRRMRLSNPLSTTSSSPITDDTTRSTGQRPVATKSMTLGKSNTG